ncbi:glutathionylspermidine synthase family protein [Escherichia coli]
MAAYCFTLRQIEEQIEKPTAELHQMCLEVVDRAVKDEEILTQLAIAVVLEVIAESWRACDPSLYGRMDFAWCGNALVKLLEYNADTPTSSGPVGLFPVVVAGGCPAQRHYSA